ncbi:MAG: hypothetical protein IKO23_02230 [Bacteroidales bacterium]|nr:hypothetical protein [Bacteroidales bacterium]
MEDFKSYWKKKAAKRKKGWAAKNERYANEHTSIEQIKETVFMPIDYDKRGYDADAFIATYFKATNPLVKWNKGVFSYSESALREAMEAEGADLQSFKIEVSKACIQGQKAPEPKIIDYGHYEWKTGPTNKVYDFEQKYHAWLKQIYKVCVDVESLTITYRQAVMTIKRYTMPDVSFAYYEVNPCVQLMQSPLLMEETGFTVLNVAFLLMDMAAELELRQEELNYYAKNLKIRKMESVTTDSIDLESWKEKTLAQKLKAIKQFMEAVTERDNTDESLSIPLGKYVIWMSDLLNKNTFNLGLLAYLDQVGLHDVKAFVSDLSSDWIVLEYQGYRMILKYRDGKMYFYPNADDNEDFDIWNRSTKRCIEFKRLTLSAIAEYLKQIPAIKEKEEQQ